MTKVMLNSSPSNNVTNPMTEVQNCRAAGTSRTVIPRWDSPGMPGPVAVMASTDDVDLNDVMTAARP
jgi:hypothetical protein